MEEIIELFRELEKVLDECGNNYSEAELQLINQESAFNKLKLIAYKYWFSDKKELTKYKRAFEILKELLSLDKDTSLDGKVVLYTLYFTGEIPYENYERLGKEQYELLEELMGK